ncbi:MAG: tRNA pseudouridine(38-40) synthase TruA [Bacteroidales bacterium]|nr:tRNA pseudouridine(38-40) synthase TruA [Bacteroidales bacterium]
MRYSIKLSYRGADFCGWQIQPDAPSVQRTVEKALSTLLRAPVSIVGAGRTDTGVNAKGYIAHFDSAAELDTGELCHKLNAILPNSIAVHEIQKVSDDFHARFSATKREYTYFLHRVKDPFAESFSFQYSYPNLDFDAMNEAAGHLLGKRDFSCFEKTGGDNKTSICTIYEARWFKQDEDHWYFRISADRFLRNMVRAIVGTLLETGRGRRSPESVIELLESGDRCSAGESVPGHALFLSKIEY